MMKEKLIGCLTMVASILVCGLFISQLMAGLFAIGRTAVQLGLMVV